MTESRLVCRLTVAHLVHGVLLLAPHPLARRPAGNWIGNRMLCILYHHGSNLRRSVYA